MAEFDPSMHRFRKNGDKYTYNDQDVSKEEFDQKQAEVDQAMQSIAPRPKPGRSLKDRAADAFKDLEIPPSGNKKGGVITCKMSTHTAKKNANW